MTNEEYIRRGVSRRRLAEMLVVSHELPDYDEDIDGEWYQCGSMTVYITSDGSEFLEDYKGAVQYECWWLAQQKV